MLFTNISYLELWQTFYTRSKTILFNIGRGYHVEQFCEIILNLDQWFKKKYSLKIFLIWSFGSPFFSGAILVEGIIRNNAVKLF